MVNLSKALAEALAKTGLPVFKSARGPTESHQFAIEAAAFGGGQVASKTLREAGFLACGIGLPIAPVEGDMNGLRIGTPELVRRGVTPADAPELAALIAEALRANDPATVAPRTAVFRRKFRGLHYVNAPAGLSA
jgi:glycine hydroxymethyltransferase